MYYVSNSRTYTISKKKISQEKTENTRVVVNKSLGNKLQKNETKNKLIIKMDFLPVMAITDETNLVEITDNKVIAYIDNLIPGFMQTGNAINNVAQAIKGNGEVLYRAIIPSGAELLKSKEIPGAFRGIFSGTKGIKGHVNLVAIETQNGTIIVTNTVAMAMGVASIIVGQYYMMQINAKLEVLSDGISQIQNFQNNEYRSRVFSLVTHVKKIADFQIEILENYELRLSKISQLDSLEEECTQLLGQANLTLVDFTKKIRLKYKEYKNILENAQDWFMYQKSLLDILYKISDLRYTLYLGVVSREQCTAILPTYFKQVSDTQEQLTAWYEGTINQLGIDLNKFRRRREGFDKAIYFFSGLFKDDANFSKIEEKTIDMIRIQKIGHNNIYKIDKSELYTEDVQLIAKNGKIYYLPNND